MPDGLKVEAIDAAQGGRLIRTLDCAVNLLPEFRAAALTKFSAAPKGTQYLFAVTEAGSSSPSAVALMSSLPTRHAGR